MTPSPQANKLNGSWERPRLMRGAQGPTRGGHGAANEPGDVMCCKATGAESQLRPPKQKKIWRSLLVLKVLAAGAVRAAHDRRPLAIGNGSLLVWDTQYGRQSEIVRQSGFELMLRS
jgi:hypothetical protein